MVGRRGNEVTGRAQGEAAGCGMRQGASGHHAATCHPPRTTRPHAALYYTSNTQCTMPHVEKMLPQCIHALSLIRFRL